MIAVKSSIKKFAPVLAMVVLFSTGTALGEFVMIDDFENDKVGEIDGQGDWTADSGLDVEIEAGTANHVFTSLAESISAVAFNDGPSVEIADGERGTLFFRFKRGFTNHVIWGLSDVDEPSEWGDFEVGIGIRYRDGRVEGPLDIRSAGQYIEVADVPEDEWINTWMVIDNENDEFQVYAQSETAFPEQTLLTDGLEDTFLFRNGTDESLRTFFLRVGANLDLHDDDHYLDDIYLDPSGENLSFPSPGGVVHLQAGDADMDLDFDQFDLIKVQVAAKYLSGEAATWGEGDWDGAPGGEVGNPPAGNGRFDQVDIIAALAGNHYLSGSYGSIRPHPEGDSRATLVYDPDTGSLALQTGATELTSINVDSAAAIFTGEAAQNLGGSFDNDADDNIFKATFGSSFGSLSFGNVAQLGLSEPFLLNDLTVVGSLAGGGDLGDVDLIYVPEPATVFLLAIGLMAVMASGSHGNRRRVRK